MSENQISSVQNPESIQPSICNSTNGPNTYETSGEANLKFLKRHIYCDVTFCVGPTKQEIKCHSFFLMARSDVFETMFSGRWDISRAINLPDTEPKVFKLFLKFIYGDEFTSNASTAVKLLELGHKYNVNVLVKKCEKLLSKDLMLENCIKIFKSACQYSLESLMEKAGNLMARSFVELSNHGTFREMDEGTLMYILQRDDLPFSEIQLFTCVLRWARFSVEKHRSCAQILQNIIPLIRFPLMTVQEFVTNVISIDILSQKDVIQLFLYFNSQGSAREDTARQLGFSCIPRKGQRQLTFELYVVKDLQSQLNVIEKIWSHSSLVYLDHHKDILGISWNPGHLPGPPHQKLKLASLMLQGINYDLLRSKWPEGCDPGSTFNVVVWIKRTSDYHSTPQQPLGMRQLDELAWVKFTTECVINSGGETEVMVEPTLEFYPDLKYHIVVEFQKTLVIKRNPGDKMFNPKYDVWTNSNLKSSFMDSALQGTLNVNISDSSFPQNLHVVRRLNFVLE